MLTPHSDLRDSPLPAPFWVVGLDEVGRGCCAGPVTAGCFAYHSSAPWLKKRSKVAVNDSKQLSNDERALARAHLMSLAASFHATAEASVEEIDRINIHHASLLAMERAFEAVVKKIKEQGNADPLWIRIDGIFLPPLMKNAPTEFIAETLVQGDGKSFAIAAASILAKERRDGFMQKLAQDFMGYGWETNVGYPTPAHKEAIRKQGYTLWHRQSFELNL
jgi:ribonuclease HII